MLNDAAARGRVAARDTILVGPRGVGKTALLTAYARIAQAQGTVVVDLQAVRGEAGLIESSAAHSHTFFGRRFSLIHSNMRQHPAIDYVD